MGRAVGAEVGATRRAALGANHALWLAVTAFYVFLAQPLGLMDISAVSPFSHIREHGGSNHLFMPTALLQRWSLTASLDKFSGGVVRVTSSNPDLTPA